MPNTNNQNHRTLCNKSNFERLYISQYIMLPGWMSTIYTIQCTGYKMEVNIRMHSFLNHISFPIHCNRTLSMHV